MKRILEQLSAQDEEHCSISLTHENEWCLGAYPSGFLIWENLEQGEPRHMKNVPHEHVLKLWQELANGNLAAIEKEPWLAGYGN